MTKNELKRFYTAWEFCRDSQDWIETSHYKTVSKYMVKAWEEE